MDQTAQLEGQQFWVALDHKHGNGVVEGARAVAAPVRGLTFSVIINTVNRAEFLADCLIALRQQTYRDFEVIVVQGPCTDATAEILADHGGACTVVRCAERNLSVSRNFGIAAASGDVCAFIDDDAVAHPQWLEELSRGYASPAVGGVGGFTMDNTGNGFQCRYTVCDRFGNATLLDHIDPAARLGEAGLWLFPSLLGTNSSFRTELLRQIGGFDERFEYMLDETDVCLRLADLRRCVITAPKAMVLHRYAPSHSRDHRRIAKDLVAPSRSKAHFVFKHGRGRLPLSELSAELDRFRRDLQFSNRWHVDRAMIDSRHFLRLNNDVDIGLDEGIESGARADQRTRRLEPARSAAAPRTWRPFVVGRTDTRLRIALVSQGYPPRDTAGIARWTAELAHGLAARGHEVHVITVSDESRRLEYQAGVWIHAVPSIHRPGERAPIDLPASIHARAAAVLREARRIQEDFGLDVVSAPIWDVEGILCRAHLDIPVVTSLHTAYRMVLPLKEAWRRDLPFRLHHVEKVMQAERWLLDQAPLLLANSQDICREITSLYGLTRPQGAFAVVPHGIAPADPAVQHESGPGGQVRVLYVGRIERRKGLDVLLAALPALFAAHPKLRVDVVGAAVPAEAAFTAETEALRETLRGRERAGRIVFHGYVDEAALDGFYAGCDVLVVPSRYESFGLIAIEAMRFGKPVVAARVGGLAEIIEPGVSGELFTSDSAAALGEALGGLLADSGRRRLLGQQAALAFARRFTRAAMARAVEACLRSLLNPHSPPPLVAARAAAATSQLPRARRRLTENGHGPSHAR